jgi:hypothetical protein
MEIQRGDVVQEVLWLERGGVLEYARLDGDQVLSHRRGLLPWQRFQQLLTGVETHGQAAPGVGPSYRAALHATGAPGELFLDEGTGGFGDALFRITAVLPEGVQAGTYVRLGAETAGPPAGVSQSSTMNVGLGRELCRLPGRLVFLDEAAAEDLDQLPRDGAGEAWVGQGGRWWPVEFLAHQP